jgi:uncharacterized protein YwgA
MASLAEAQAAVAIVRDAGGRIVGRTRLQKVGFVLEAAGLGVGFPFGYKHYGPYSEELSAAARTATVVGLINEIEQPTSWGARYSTFTTTVPADPNLVPARAQLIAAMIDVDAVELELAATALFLARSGYPNAWAETARRKPEKAAMGRLDRAIALYNNLRQIPTPRPLPAI